MVIVGGATVEQRFPVPLGNVDLRSSSRPGPGYHDEAWERGAAYPDTYSGVIEWTTRRNLEACVRWMDTGDLDVESMITHRLPLEDAATGFEAMLESPGETVGVVLEP